MPATRRVCVSAFPLLLTGHARSDAVSTGNLEDKEHPRPGPRGASGSCLTVALQMVSTFLGASVHEASVLWQSVRSVAQAAPGGRPVSPLSGLARGTCLPPPPHPGPTERAVWQGGPSQGGAGGPLCPPLWWPRPVGSGRVGGTVSLEPHRM